MPSKKHREKVVYRITERYLESIKTIIKEKIFCRGYFEEIFSCSSAVDQVLIIKKIKVFFSESKKELNQYEDFHILGLLMYESPLKFPQNGALKRLLSQLYDDYQEELFTSLEYAFEVFLNFLLRDMSIYSVSSFADCLIGLTDHFPIGEKVVNSKCNEIWMSFTAILTYLHNQKRKNPAEISNSFSCVLQAFMNFFNHSAQLKNTLLVQDSVTFNAMSPIIVDVIQNLLIADETPLDCRIKAGIALCAYHYASNNQYFIRFVLHMDSVFKLSQYSFPSQLCIYNGILAVVSFPEFITEFEGDLLGLVLLHRMLHLTDSVKESELLLLNIRVLHQWTKLARDLLTCSENELKSSEKLETFKKSFKDISLVNIFYNLVLLFEEHSLDALRHASYDLFLEVLRLHSLSIDFDTSTSSILRDLANKIMELPDHSEGKFGLLARIVVFVEPQDVLHWFPCLPEISFTALQEPSLVSSVCELITSFLLTSLKKDSKAHVANAWFDPLANHLCFDSKGIFVTLNEKLLPKLFKLVPSSVDIILEKLKNKGTIDGGLFGISAIITCLKFHQGNLSGSCLNCWPRSTQLLFLNHACDQIRLSVWSFLCESHKTTEPIPSEDLDLIKESLPYNINCQAPAFRQRLVSFMKKVLLRIEKSMHFIDKKEGTKSALPEANDIKNAYKNFLQWLKEFLFNCLKPGANFPTRDTVLNLLYNIHSILTKIHVVDSPVEAETLLYALKDTYENNKVLSLAILSKKGSSFLSLAVKDYYSDSLQTALVLASSTKPPDTVTAGYLFSLMVRDEQFNEVFLEHIKKQGCSLPPSNNCIYYTSYLAVKLLIGELFKHYEVAKNSLLEAAANAPMYGVLASIRMILSRIEFSSINGYPAKEWTSLVHTIIELCQKVSTTVETVVCNSSPEGHLPLELDATDTHRLPTIRDIKRPLASLNADEVDSLPEEVRATKAHAITAQVLLLCCWRTHKEISLLLGDITQNIPIQKELNSKVTLSQEKVLDIGHYFIFQMTMVKHKGAIEQAYVGFTKLCKTLWQCSIEELRELPKVWMKDLVSAIKGEKEILDMCATRRSAGLPFIVQAILSSQITLSSPFFKGTINTLLELANEESENPDTQVHAFNILRALFRDAYFSEVLLPFTSEALKISISGFKSQSWAVRNSSTMLFSALHVRMFGVIHSDDETKKNKFTEKVFFNFYKGTYSVLYDELKYCASVLAKEPYSVCKVPSLYPVLLVLRRLHTDHGTSEPSLGGFIPFLQICACSPVLKIRNMAAKVLAPFLPCYEILPMLQTLFGGLTPVNSISQNEIHGKFLQIIYIIKESHRLSDCKVESLLKHLKECISQHFELASGSNPCYTTRAAFLEIILLALSMGMKLNSENGCQLFTYFLDEVKDLCYNPDKEHFLCVLGVILLNYALHIKDPKSDYVIKVSDEFPNLLFIVDTLLTVPYEPLQCIVLKFLIALFEDPKSFFKLSLDFPVYPVFLGTSEYSLVLQNLNDCELSELSNSTHLAHILLKIINNEDANSSCIGLAYHLLSYIQASLKGDFYELKKYDTLNLVLNHMEQCVRNDVFNSMLVYSTHLAVNIYMVLALNKDAKSLDYNNLVSKLEEWSACIERSAQPENCISGRIATVHALKAVPYYILNNTHKIPSCCVYPLWQALLSLLIDDEPDIKKAAGTILPVLQSPSALEFEMMSPTVPLSTLENMIRIFTEREPFEPSDCVAILLQWMISNKHELPDDVGDEQPFDKGEMNVFAEDIVITELVSKYLTKYLQKHSKGICEINRKLISSFHLLKDDVLNLEAVTAMCLKDCLDVMKYLETSVTILPQLDVHFEYYILQLCQRLHVLICLKPWCTSIYDSDIRDLIKRIENFNFRTFYLDGLLTKLLNCI